MSLASLAYPFLLAKSKISPKTRASVLSPPPLESIHHVKLAVSDLDISLDWYLSIMSASHTLALDQYTPSGKRYAVELSMPALGLASLQLRLSHEGPFHIRGSDSVTWAVKTRNDLETWKKWLDAKAVKRSKVIRGAMEWLLVFEADGLEDIIAIFRQLKHEPTVVVCKNIEDNIHMLLEAVKDAPRWMGEATGRDHIQDG
ncbi:hypothetical protein MMC13_002111 [Lambiella insularis]|nr:hypothetical protein [Lambiella insularis]